MAKNSVAVPVCKGQKVPIDHSSLGRQAMTRRNHVTYPQFNSKSLIGLVFNPWGKKDWLPIIKVRPRVRQGENCLNKMGLKGCKWSSLYAPSNENPPNCPFLKLGKNSFLSLCISPLEQIVQFECPRHWKPFVSSNSGVCIIPFLTISPLEWK